MSVEIKKGNTANIEPGQLEKRVNRHETILYAVVIVLLFMLGQLLIDSFRFSSVTYKEYSEKTASVEVTQKTNEALLRQIQDLLEQSKQDREIIKGLLKK